MKLCVIGGGTAGAWACAYLEKKFPHYEITAYESNDIPIIGVGESTLPQVITFLNECGLPEEEWVKESNATRKLGNVKQLWRKDQTLPELDFTFWYNDDLRFQDWMPRFLANETTPQTINDELWEESTRATAIHLDANGAARFAKSRTKNVKYIKETLTELPPGYDLYIDCTGFARAFTPDKTLVVPEGHLVDSAWVCPLELDDDADEAHTYSIARDYGWQWRITLQNRIGTGYVYSSKYISDEDAKKQFESYIGNSKRYNNIEPKNLKWNAGYLKNPWTDNVVSIGLSAGFVDPLESNSLYMSIFGVELLAKCLERGLGAKHYNKLANKIWKDNCDYIRMHYSLSDRDDTQFWLDTKRTQTTDKELVWKKYQVTKGYKTTIFIDALYATLGVYFDQTEHYKPKTI